MKTLPLLLLLTACGSGDWNTTTWGEEYIEQGIPSADFEDGCSAQYDRFVIVMDDVALIDGDDEPVAEQDDALVFDMALPGPHDVAHFDTRATFYDTARFAIRPATGAKAGNVTEAEAEAMAGNSVHAVGSITCGADTVQFDWAFDTATTYLCAPDDLTIPSGGAATTEFTIHGDHLFYDGLENEDAVVRGQAIVDADADADGTVTLAELAAVPVAPLGYRVGQYSDVTDMRQFVSFLTRTLGHVDGEGHCQVDL